MIFYAFYIAKNDEKPYTKPKNCGIIYAESLALQVFALRAVRTACACVIDGFAKMSVQAHIFAS